MRNFIRSVALLAVLGSRVAIAQTVGNARSSAGPTSPTVSSSLTRDARLATANRTRGTFCRKTPAISSNSVRRTPRLTARSIFVAAAEVAALFGIPLVTAGLTEDKADVNARVAWSGVGIDLATNEPTPQALREAVRTVLENPTYRGRAS